MNIEGMPEVPITAEPKEQPVIELFVGNYTGMLKVLGLKNGRKITFTPAFPLVEGVAYVLHYVPSTGKCRLIHLVIPNI